jgi:hypothetical protein
VFFTVLLGKVLQALYRLTGPDVPVYAGFLHLIQALCAGLAAWLLPLGDARGWKSPSVHLAAAAYAAIFAMFCVQITFTMVASLLAAHAFWLLTRTNGWRQAAVAGGMAGLAALIRLDTLKLVMLVLAVPGAIWLAGSWRQWTRPLCALLPVVILLAAEQAVSRWCVEEGYAAYSRFNGLRGQIHGTPLLAANMDNRELLEATGWSDTEYRMFANWGYFDERKFNENTLRSYLAHARLLPAPKASPVPFFERARRFMVDRSYLMGMVYVVAALACLATSKRTLFALLAHAIILVSIGVYLDVYQRLPTRLRESMLMASLIGTIFLWFGQRQALSVNRAKLAALAAVLFVVWRGWIVLEYALVIRWDQREVRANVESLIAAHPDTPVYLWHIYSPPVEDLHPFRKLPKGAELMLYGWSIFSPYFYQEIHRVLGITKGSEYLPALFRHPKAIYAAPEAGIQMLVDYLREAYGLEANPVRLESTGPVEYWKLEPTRS